MQRPVKAKIGMTVDEREDIIVLLTRLRPDAPFECQTFSDGSVGLSVKALKTEEWFLCKCPEDWLGRFASVKAFSKKYRDFFKGSPEYYRIGLAMFPNARLEDLACEEI